MRLLLDNTMTHSLDANGNANVCRSIATMGIVDCCESGVRTQRKKERLRLLPVFLFCILPLLYYSLLIGYLGLTHAGNFVPSHCAFLHWMEGGSHDRGVTRNFGRYFQEVRLSGTLRWWLNAHHHSWTWTTAFITHCNWNTLIMRDCTLGDTLYNVW